MKSAITMSDLPGYVYRGTQLQGTRHVARWCTRERDGLPVIVKVPRADRPTPQANAALKHEIEIARRLSDERIVAWRARLLEALGANGQDIIALIPEIELIIGPQPAVADYGSEQSQARFQETFRRFVRAFAQAEHPLVLFLDDLQWADTATLKLLRSLTTDPELSHLMFLGAYRDNKVDAAHPLSHLLSQLRGEHASITPLRLGPLLPDDVTRLLSETLQVPPASALDLGQIVASKTLGNPFFVNEFLAAVHRDGLLTFDADRGSWRRDADEIRRAEITENVEIEALGQLPEMTDVHRLTETRLLVQAMASAYNAAPMLFPLIVLRAVQITIRHGLTGLSAHAFLTYGVILLTALGDYDTAYRFGRLSIEILERFKAEGLRAKIYHVHGLYIRHYKEPSAASLAETLEAVPAASSSDSLASRPRPSPSSTGTRAPRGDIPPSRTACCSRLASSSARPTTPS